MKKTIFVISILILTTSLKAQWTWQYNYLYGEPDIPNWYFELDNKLDKIAILPFTGYSFQGEAIARRIESEIRSKLLSTGVFSLIEREYLMDIVREKHISLNNISSNDIDVFKKFIDADVLIVGNITKYSQEEIYLEHVSGTQASGDKYKRIVSIDFNFRIIKVNDGTIVYEKPYNSTYTSTGFKNIHYKSSSYDNNATFGENLLTGIVEGAIGALEVSGELTPYSTLDEYCLNDIIQTSYSKLVPLKSKYKESWQYNARRYKKRKYTKTYLGKVFDEESMNNIRFIDDIFEENAAHLSDTILYESFLENKNSWTIADNEYKYFQFYQGRYYIQSRKETSFYESSYTVNTAKYKMSFNLRYEDGSTDEGCYIKFRSSTKRYYVLIDASGSSYFKVTSYGSEWEDIKDWTKTDLIESNEDNKIDIININDKLYLFINGRFAFEKDGIPYNSTNQIGLGSSYAKYSFDNLLITKIE